MKKYTTLPKNYKLILYTALSILWTLIIFSFSLQNGEESSQTSGGIVEWFVETFFPFAAPYAEQLEFCIRKAAHFTEYFILGIFVSLATGETKFSKQRILALAVCVLIAGCDETIQLFSGGRSGQLADVLLDSCGSFCGSTICFQIKNYLTGLRKSPASGAEH